MGLMRRRYGYYWAKLIGALLILAAWVVGFTLIGDSWWQLANAGVLAVVMTQIAFLGRDAESSDLQVRPVERLGQPDHRQPAGRDQQRLVAKQTQPPPRQPEQGGSRPRHRIDCPRSHARTSNQAAQPADVAHQRLYFFPILLLLGLLMHHEAIRG
jgi:hypothetical protein